jgi:hypothetical protein
LSKIKENNWDLSNNYLKMAAPIFAQSRKENMSPGLPLQLCLQQNGDNYSSTVNNLI